MSDHQQTQAKGRTAPDPDDPRKPEDPPDLHKGTLKYVLRRTLREFSRDHCTDLAASLVYFAVLALFPALIALVSLLGLVGQGGAVTQVVGQVVGAVAEPETARTVTGYVEGFVASQSGSAVGLGLVIGLVGALWSASGYVGAFSRAMNRVYEVEEGRPVWKLRPVMLLVTLVALLLLAVALVIVVVSGPVAEAVGDVVGLGSTAVTVWSIAKWPVLAGVVVLVIALLYWATPNVQQPKFRWVSLGSVVAIVVWLAASVGFALYVTNFGSYDATYGALAGVVVFLLWLWITNIALLLGAEVDAEVERGRELQAGIAAEESVQLPPRDTRASDKKAAAEARDVDRGWALRVGAEQDRTEDGGGSAGSPSGEDAGRR